MLFLKDPAENYVERRNRIKTVIIVALLIF